MPKKAGPSPTRPELIAEESWTHPDQKAVPTPIRPNSDPILDLNAEESWTQPDSPPADCRRKLDPSRLDPIRIRFGSGSDPVLNLIAEESYWSAALTHHPGA